MWIFLIDQDLVGGRLAILNGSPVSRKAADQGYFWTLLMTQRMYCQIFSFQCFFFFLASHQVNIQLVVSASFGTMNSLHTLGKLSMQTLWL